MEIKNNSKEIGIWIGTAVVFLIGFVSLVVGRKTVESPAVQIPLDSVDIKKQSSVYKDGSYSSTGSYMSPGGLDKIAVNLTLEKDIVTDISVTPLVADKVSVKYQGMFLSGYRPMVIGKNIKDVKLDKVSGSSLTSIGFNEAIEQIKLEAKS
jgi:uncharacterized protein with FMN-binding domain